jgi:hypothetical protein
VALALLIVGSVAVASLASRQQGATRRELEAPISAAPSAAASPALGGSSQTHVRPAPAKGSSLGLITDPEIATNLSRQIRRSSLDKDPIVVVSLDGERAWINFRGTNIELSLARLDGAPGNTTAGSSFSRRFVKSDIILLVQYEVLSSNVIADMGCERIEYRLSIEVSNRQVKERIEPESYGEGC